MQPFYQFFVPGLPICFPQFGPGDVIPQHGGEAPDLIKLPAFSVVFHPKVAGFARNMDWTFVEAESSDGKCVLELVDSEETKKAVEDIVHQRWRKYRKGADDLAIGSFMFHHVEC